VTGPDGSASVERTLGRAPVRSIRWQARVAHGLACHLHHTAMAGAAAVLGSFRATGSPRSWEPRCPTRSWCGRTMRTAIRLRTFRSRGSSEGGGGLAPARASPTPRPCLHPVDARAVRGKKFTATAVISGVGTVGFTATGDPGAPGADARGAAVGNRRARRCARRPAGRAASRAGRVPVRPASTSRCPSFPAAPDPRHAYPRHERRAVRVASSLSGPPGSYALAFSATNYTGVTSRSIGLARAGTTTAILSDDPDPSAAGAPVRVRFRVQSPGGTPDGTVRVDSDDGATCSPTVAAGECSLVPASTGARTLTATYADGAEFGEARFSVAHRPRASTAAGGSSATASRSTSGRQHRHQPEYRREGRRARRQRGREIGGVR
jgi:hypothetical protein